MIAYYGSKLSPHMPQTPEGFLICHDVKIARTGLQEYSSREIGLDSQPERLILVDRCPEDVFDPAAMASFEGKDVTNTHPAQMIGQENQAAYSKGHAENMRRVGDYLVADLYLKDPTLISEVKSGAMRDVSCGYYCQYEADGAGYKQTHIRGNHIAIVPRGRDGREVAIQDSAAGPAEKGNFMNEPEKKSAAAVVDNAPESAPAANAPEDGPAKNTQQNGEQPHAQDNAPAPGGSSKEKRQNI